MRDVVVPTPDERDCWLALDDAKLLRDCREERRAAGGPGGQKRNRTASTVRLTHGPTNLVANAGEDRSLRANRIHAVRRLRHKLAASVRRELDAMAFEPPAWWREYAVGGSLRMNPANPLHPVAAAMVLDILAASAADPAAAAVHLGVSPRSLVRFLREPGELWRAANDLRVRWSLEPLHA